MPDTQTNILAATAVQDTDRQTDKTDATPVARMSDSTIAWMIHTTENSARMSRDEAYRLEIAKHLS